MSSPIVVHLIWLGMKTFSILDVLVGPLKNNGVRCNGLQLDAQDFSCTLFIESHQSFNVTVVYGSSLRRIQNSEQYTYFIHAEFSIDRYTTD